MISEKDFKQYASQGFTNVPVAKEILADLENPITVYKKLADEAYSYLFESVQGGEKWSRYSFIGLSCNKIIKVHSKTISIIENGKTIATEESQDPIEWIENFRQQFKAPDIPNLPRFFGGLVGYFGYDTVRHIEARLGDCKLKDTLETPDMLFMVSNEIIAFDNLNKKAFVIVIANPHQKEAWEHANNRIKAIIDKLRNANFSNDQTVQPNNKFQANMTKDQFKEAVNRAKAYILAGDVMQVVLSQRLSQPYQGSPFNLYRALRTLNPSPYLYYLNCDDFHIIGSSPEILVRLEDDTVTVRPLAGTRPRGTTEGEDNAHEQELLIDPKEIAEHLMLIDLGRNDIGRISEIGSVHVTEKMGIERYSHVMHIVSNVEGKKRPEIKSTDVLRATFPAGTLTGAPKIRAMEIIDELEPVKRGIYGGTVGYIGWNGNLDMAIAIRTAVIKDKTLHVQAGAGIVADSIPEKEWEETMNKAKAVLRAAEMTSEGL